MNIVLLVVDSLRASALAPEHARTPFLDRLGAETLRFTRAYATECWTLPSHVSMFTGALPSEHGAHFRTMAYTGDAATIAEILSRTGYWTESVTRNSIFDGSMPGVTRGFARLTIPLSERGTGLNPLALLVVLSKPRVRRQIAGSGFFHPLQRDNREFLARFTRAMLLPADVLALDHVLEVMRRERRFGRPYFVFCNLYDVHAPYSPSQRSMFRPWWPPRHWPENLLAPVMLAYLGSHAYLRPGFHLREHTRRLLLGRYHRAAELMDEKLARFHRAARRDGLLDDTLLIVTSDHGEGFGEHGLYLHDASVYHTHLHVPLWIHHPDVGAGEVDDVVSLQSLFGLMRAVATGAGLDHTILCAGYRAARPVALAQHFHYDRLPDALPRYRQDIMAAVGRSAKVILRREGIERYDLQRDPGETAPAPGTLEDFADACRAEGASAASVEAARDTLRSWHVATALDAPARSGRRYPP